MLIALNWEVQFGEYTLGIWFLDKFSTALTILLVAYIAQQIFNKNAKSREDRERRLAALYRLMNSLHEIEEIIKGLYDPRVSIGSILSTAKKEIKNMRTTMLLHKLPLQKSLNNLYGALEQSSQPIATMNAIMPKYEGSEYQDVHRLTNFLENVLDPAIADLKTNIIKQFKNVEINH